MRIAIITSNNLWFSPYVKIYTSILDKEGVSYDIITWCRDGKDEEGCIQYKERLKSTNPIVKFFRYLSYASFVKKTLNRGKYDKLIVFTPQVGIFISSYLKKFYRGQYIFDYRDLSIEQKPYFKRAFLRLLDNSVANVISSPGFMEHLPANYDYILSHNFDVDIVRDAIQGDASTIQPSSETINVLTIGGIRDYESNVQVINSLANKEGFTVNFVGKGPSAESLKTYSENSGFTNVHFEGYYPKEKEKDYINNSTFLNIFYPRKPSHDSALSNRFYNSLIYKKPMITTAETTQGYYALKYELGVALADCTNLAEDLRKFLMNTNIEEYNIRCDSLLQEFLLDYDRFLTTLKSFISTPSV